MNEPLYWTETPPKRPGHYWVDKSSRFGKSYAQLLTEVCYADNDESVLMDVCLDPVAHRMQVEQVGDFPYRWAGPIDIPQEPESSRTPVAGAA